MSIPLSSTVDCCRVCDAQAIRSILDLGQQPLANSLRLSSADDLPVFSLEICRCEVCGTVQLTETVAPEILFRHYVWITGTSEGARHYSHIFCERIIERANLPDPLFVIEVASNDGTFLRCFVDRGDRVIGVDPAENVATEACKAGIPTIAEFFGLNVAKRIVEDEGQADIVFARNVLPHVADAKDIIGGIAHCLSPNGIGAIEFHRADVILEELHYDSIYHEHLFFYSLHSMSKLLALYELIPFDVTTSPISGGSFVVYFSKSARTPTAILSAVLEGEIKIGVERQEPWQKFAKRCMRHRILLQTLVEKKKAEGKLIIGYGASARSSTMLNFCGIDYQFLEAIADRAPLKHGKYTPGTNIPIISPEQAFALNPDVVLLLAWNFRDEILEQIRKDHAWSGEVIIPLPGDPELIEIKCFL